MKIEIGESMFLSWLRHVKECQLVQTNWKASPEWDVKNIAILEPLVYESSNYYKTEYGLDLYKKNRGYVQLIKQAEIDVIGINLEDNKKTIYAVDVAFHEYGLNYGATSETVSRIVKKCIRTALCLIGYFNIYHGNIIFASPKINPSVYNKLTQCTESISHVFSKFNLDFKVQIIANEDFKSRILAPVLSVLDNVADTSELFMRSLQMYNLFTKNKISKSKETTSRITTNLQSINSLESSSLSSLSEMKIGVIARTVLKRILESGYVPDKEIEQLQTKEYSKEVLDIQYPLLLKVNKPYATKPTRYYANPIKIKGQLYYLCSEWFETSANNDRPFLLKWLALHIKL